MSNLDFYFHLEDQKGLKDWTEKLEFSQSEIQDLTVLECKLKFLQHYCQTNNVELTTASADVFTGEGKTKQKLDKDSLMKTFPDKTDFWVCFDENKKIRCGRNGCDKEFIQSENTETSCNFHSGSPTFHEGSSFWSCCGKKGLSFDQFLQIAPCSTGRHIPAKEEPKKKKPQQDNKSNVPEVFRTAPIIPQQQKKQEEKPKEENYVEEKDEESEKINLEKGTSCKRNGCQYKFENKDVSYSTNCVYHSGGPIFHEGSCGWSCCKKKVLEFDEFMKIEGCRSGQHKFLPFKSQKDPGEITCRFDFYQSSTKLTLNIYAKNVNKEETKIKSDFDRVDVFIKFNDGKFFKKLFVLEGIIDPAKSKFEIGSAKIEISLFKTNSIQWTNLEKK